MRKLHGAIAAGVTLASVMLPVLQVSARPVEPDFPCYVRTSAGKLVDLTASMCAFQPLETTQASSLVVPRTGNAPLTPDSTNSYDPRYRSVRTENRGGVTRTISGGAGDDLSDERDRETTTSGIYGNGGEIRRSGNCAYASGRAADGSLCGGRAASERPGGR